MSASPPLAVMVGKMPEILPTAQKEIQIGAGFEHEEMASLYQLSGAYGLAPRWELNVGTSMIDVINNGEPEAVMGFVGAKYGLLAKNKWSIALPFGLGAGCGGFNGNEDVNTDYACSDGFAFGGYYGIDFGYRFGKVVGIYNGTRVQITDADGLPTTWYLVSVWGLQFDITKHWFASIETGPAYIYSEGWETMFKTSGAFGFRW